MTSFFFNRELDYQYLDSKFKDDLYLAREVIGSFCETMDMDLQVIENALDQRRYPVFLRVCQRLTSGLEMMGLMKEIEYIQVLRSHFALKGACEEFHTESVNLLNKLYDLNSLFVIEQQRLEVHLEQRLRHN